MERLIKTFHLEKRIIQNVLRKIDINRSFTNSSCQLPNPSIAHFENIFLPLIETLYIYIYSLSIVSNKQPCFPFSFFFFFFFSIQAPHDGSMIILYWNSIDPLNVDNVEKTQSGMYDHNTQEFCTGISISFVHFSQLFLSLPLFLFLSLFLVAPSP